MIPESPFKTIALSSSWMNEERRRVFRALGTVMSQPNTSYHFSEHSNMSRFTS